MSLSLSAIAASPAPVALGVTSTLVLSDRLITLAQDADRAGFPAAAARLVVLAHAVFDEPARN